MEPPEVRGCPWCGAKPHNETHKVHNCGEPYFTVRIYCPNCRAGLSVVARDAEHAEATRMWPQHKHKSHAELVTHVVIRDRLLPMWNSRVDDIA